MTHPVLYPIAFAAISVLTYVLTRPIAATDPTPVAFGRATVIVVQREAGGP